MRFGVGYVSGLVKAKKISMEDRNKIVGMIITISGTAFAVGILAGLTIAVMVL